MLSFFKKKTIPSGKPLEQDGSLESLWVAHLELQGVVNKLIQSVHKTLRARGRALQAEEEVKPVQKSRKFGMIVPYGNKDSQTKGSD